MSITVLLAEDNATMRSALRSFLRRSGGLEVVGEAADGLEAVRLALEVRPDVVVMDLGLPKLEGLEATRRIRTACPSSQVVVLSGTYDENTVDEARAVGASAIVPKERAFEELVPAIKSAGAGRAGRGAGS